MLPFSYTGMKLIHDEKVQRAVERYRFYAEPKRRGQGLLYTLGKALARFTQQAGNEKRAKLSNDTEQPSVELRM